MIELLAGLEIKESGYKLPNGNSLRLFPLTVFERIDIHSKLSNIENDREKESVIKDLVILSCRDSSGDPIFNKEDSESMKALDLLSRYGDGEELIKMFGAIMDLSGSTDEDMDEAKKK